MAYYIEIFTEIILWQCNCINMVTLNKLKKGVKNDFSKMDT